MTTRNFLITLCVEQSLFHSFSEEEKQKIVDDVKAYLSLLAENFYTEKVAVSCTMQYSSYHAIQINNQEFRVAKVYRPCYSYEENSTYWTLRFSEALFYHREMVLVGSFNPDKLEAERIQIQPCFSQKNVQPTVEMHRLRIDVTSKVYTSPHNIDSFSREEYVAAWHSQLYYDKGVLVPKPTFHIDDTLPETGFRIWINDLPYPVLHSFPEHYFMEMPAVTSGEVIGNPHDVNHPHFATIHVLKNSNELQPETDTCFAWMGMLNLMTSAVVQLHASCWINKTFIAFQLDEQPLHADVLALALEQYTMEDIVYFLKRLSEERIPIRNLKKLLHLLTYEQDAMYGDAGTIAFGSTSALTVIYSENKKLQGKDLIVESLRRGLQEETAVSISKDNNFNALIMGVTVEETWLQLDMDGERKLFNGVLDSIETQLTEIPRNTKLHGVVCQDFIRPSLASYLQKIHPWLCVYSYRDLAPWINVTPLGYINVVM